VVRRVSFVGYGCLVGDHDDGGHCGPGLPAFAAPFRCTVDPAAPPRRPGENETTQNPNDETATAGNPGPRLCTEQGNSAKCTEDR
jgi:hypothetical protein